MISPVLLARNDAVAAEELLSDALGHVERFDRDDGLGSLTTRLIWLRNDLKGIIDDLEKRMEESA